MKNIKSQAAMEFLMTYGWAILVVLVAIGALAYFGVLSPDKFLPAKCTLSAGLACLDHKATANSLTLVVQNSLGFDVSIDKVEAEGCTAAGTGAAGSVTTITNGNKMSLTGATGGPAGTSALTCNNAGLSKYNGKLNITYTVTDTGVQHKNQGQVTTRIE